VPTQSASPTLGFGLMLSSFAAVVIGGFDRPAGAMGAALGVGVLSQLLGGYVLPNWSEAWPFVIILVILVIKPEGLVKPSVGVRY